MEDDVPLIISIDKADSNQDVLSVANEFEWEHGEKAVVYQKENLKLRNHILKCGDYALKYGNVIILEDDLYVSKYFYQYAESALAFTDADERIGGVSLYNHKFNVEAAEPFEAFDDGYDNWYFQFASSWGEAWTQKQWAQFRVWYAANPDIADREEVPVYVRSWPTSSWLKYFIAYLVETNKYFIYPRISLTTNFGDAGTHVNKNNTNHQVPLQNAPKRYSFSRLENPNSVYDAFFESIRVKEYLCASSDRLVVVDLYGHKSLDQAIKEKSIIITRRVLPYRVLRSVGCCMRPHEVNIFHEVDGDDFWIYDTAFPETNDRKMDRQRKAQYNLRQPGAVRGDGELPERASTTRNRRLKRMPVYRNARYTGNWLLFTYFLDSS